MLFILVVAIIVLSCRVREGVATPNGSGSIITQPLVVTTAAGEEADRVFKPDTAMGRHLRSSRDPRMPRSRILSDYSLCTGNDLLRVSAVNVVVNSDAQYFKVNVNPVYTVTAGNLEYEVKAANIFHTPVASGNSPLCDFTTCPLLANVSSMISVSHNGASYPLTGEYDYEVKFYDENGNQLSCIKGQFNA